MSIDFIPHVTALNTNGEEETETRWQRGITQAFKGFHEVEQGRPAYLESALTRFHPLSQTAFASFLPASRNLPVLPPDLEHGIQDEDEPRHTCKSSFRLLLKKSLIFRP